MASLDTDPGHTYASEFRRCLDELDVNGMRRIHEHTHPHVPAGSDRHILAGMHMARTMAVSLPNRARFYSHAWLRDHGLPSQLPDMLKPKAERMYPRIVDAVGIACRTSSPYLKPAVDEIHGAMVDAVENAYADGRREPSFVRARMMEARGTVTRKLFG